MPQKHAFNILGVVGVLVASAVISTGVAWAGGTERVLHAFAGTAGGDGAVPFGGVVFDKAGNLFGTTGQGGSSAACFNGCGTVFELMPVSGGGWTETLLYQFSGGADGWGPQSSLAFDASGNLYGTTTFGGGTGGGTGCNGPGCGTVFELTPNGTGWTKSIIYSFTGTADGSNPLAGVVVDQAGNIYGTTTNGGVVFKLTPLVGGGWQETSIYTFAGSLNASGGVILDSAGSLYGTTSYGGLYDFGTVFKLSPSTNGWTQSTLHNFTSGRDGAAPAFGVIFDKNGNLYGTTQNGGSYNLGIVFKLAPSIGNWKESILHQFTGANDGAYPGGGLTTDGSGHVYGVTDLGGYYEFGVVFALTPGKRNWRETGLYSFTNGSDGSYPSGQLVLDAAGNLYGTTPDGGADGYGVVYEVIQ